MKNHEFCPECNMGIDNRERSVGKCLNCGATWNPNDTADDIVDTALDIGLGMAIGSILDGVSSNDSNPGSSDTDLGFGGFDGGDFGGGGASSDY